MVTKGRRDISCLPRADVDFLNREAEQGAPVTRILLAMPVRRWRDALRDHPTWVTISVLRALLAHAREELDREPLNARRALKLIVDHAPRVAVPAGSAILRTALCGDAYKDYGNALRRTGRIPQALTAVNHAVRILSDHDGLVIECAAALVLKAHIEHDRGRYREAFTLLEESAGVFARRGETRRHLQTIILHGIFLFEQEHPADAYARFQAARPIAEELQDHRELARILNNLGHCALKLGEIAAAWDYLVQATVGFTHEGMDAELPRAQWGLARLLSTRQPAEAVTDLRRLYTIFTRRGMVVEAATALLEIAAILAREEQNRDVVRALCSTIADLFAATTIPRPAREALAYLQRQASAPGEGLSADVTHVRNYFRHMHQPTIPEFAPGH